VLRRFKQELNFARQARNKTSLGFSILGNPMAIKFITMDFVEGAGPAFPSVLEKSKSHTTYPAASYHVQI